MLSQFQQSNRLMELVDQLAQCAAFLPGCFCQLVMGHSVVKIFTILVFFSVCMSQIVACLFHLHKDCLLLLRMTNSPQQEDAKELHLSASVSHHQLRMPEAKLRSYSVNLENVPFLKGCIFLSWHSSMSTIKALKHEEHL